jgi:hypothetical protein
MVGSPWDQVAANAFNAVLKASGCLELAWLMESQNSMAEAGSEAGCLSGDC